ncbi:AMP-binding protein [Brevibacillus choshinensis]|uniref:AMP-binding protein n=1 Tax=Brevibacillus choshinensis TaxID=54911 RepID=UPI002E22B2BA|nr:AMP-binding protein [Brevibacillus choshinensis]
MTNVFEQNIYQLLKQASNLAPDKVAVVDDYDQYAYRDLRIAVERLAGAFKKNGINKGDVVSFQLPNWVESIVVHQALAMIGAISNPVIPIYRQNELKYILTQSKTKMLIIPKTFRKFDFVEMVRTIHPDLPHLEKVIVLDKYQENHSLNDWNEVDFFAFMNSAAPHEEIEDVVETDPALLLYTSGTTSHPKGVIHSHKTLICEIQSIARLYELGEQDVIYMPSPVTHITGLLYGMELPFMIQGKVVLQDIWDPHKAIQHVIQEECTWTIGATPFLKDMVDTITESERTQLRLKVFACGGADVPPELILQASKVLNCYVTRVYGSSEYPTLTACGPKDLIEKAALTDGKLFEGAQAIIVDDLGAALSAGEVGELAVKGPELFLGYIQEEYNKSAFLEDGYFLTGDLAVMDADGFIEIKGRKKDIIIRGGENISVKELETLLYQHPKISTVAIVAMPDERMGEKVCAYVVLNKHVPSLHLAEINQFLEEIGIAKQKLPERLEIIEEMPITASGKIQKYLLREDIRKKLCS